MWPNWLFRIKQFWIFQITRLFQIRCHQTSFLCFIYFCFYQLLLVFAQSCYVSPVNAAGIWRLELRQQFNVLIVWGDFKFAQDTFLLLLMKRVVHIKNGSIGIYVVARQTFGNCEVRFIKLKVPCKKRDVVIHDSFVQTKNNNLPFKGTSLVNSVILFIIYLFLKYQSYNLNFYNR